MPVEISDYVEIEQRCSLLGIQRPEGFCILPRNFEHAESLSELCHESSALTMKTLFRQARLPITVYQPSDAPLSYIQENDNSWAAPVLFLTVTALSENAHCLSVALNVISNYVTDLFKGSPETTSVKLTVIIEKSQTKSSNKITKKYSYTGPSDKINELARMIEAEQ